MKTGTQSPPTRRVRYDVRAEKPQKRKGGLSDEQIEQIVYWAEKKKSGRWIASKLDIKEASVSYRMLCAGYDPWPGQRRGTWEQAGGFSKEEDARLIKLSKTHNRTEVARLMNRPRTSTIIRLMLLEVRAEKKLEQTA